jgi:hypothetical protein
MFLGSTAALLVLAGCASAPPSASAAAQQLAQRFADEYVAGAALDSLFCRGASVVEDLPADLKDRVANVSKVAAVSSDANYTPPPGGAFDAVVNVTGTHEDSPGAIAWSLTIEVYPERNACIASADAVAPD